MTPAPRGSILVGALLVRPDTVGELVDTWLHAILSAATAAPDPDH